MGKARESKKSAGRICLEDRLLNGSWEKIEQDPAGEEGDQKKLEKEVKYEKRTQARERARAQLMEKSRRHLDSNERKRRKKCGG